LTSLKIKADGEWCYVWAAIDVDTRELLAVDVSWQRKKPTFKIKLFTPWYNFVKPHQTLKRPPATPIT